MHVSYPIFIFVSILIFVSVVGIVSGVCVVVIGKRLSDPSAPNCNKEVYMEVPPGYGPTTKEKVVRKLKNAIYGLKQSPRA